MNELMESSLISLMSKKNDELREENQQLKDRIDKAIGYINQLEHSEWVSFGRTILLEILKGGKDE